MYHPDLSGYHICVMLNTAQEYFSQKLLCGEKENGLQEGSAGKSALLWGNFSPLSAFLYPLGFYAFLLCRNPPVAPVRPAFRALLLQHGTGSFITWLLNSGH